MNPVSPDPSADAVGGPTGPFVDAFDGRYAAIAHCDRLPPFLMNVVSSSDLWLFLASNGGLAAGRGDAARALFAYQTVDRLYDSAGVTGPFTSICATTDPGGEVLWEPFAPHSPRLPRVARHLYKSIEGDRVWFEEIHPGLGLAFRYGWSTAEAHGFVRRCELENLAATAVSVRVLDGLRNFLPPGIDRRLQADCGCLADAYKTAELLPSSSLAVFALSTVITDRPTPVESLHATAVWSAGLPDAAILLSDDQRRAFHAGRRPVTENRRRGIRSQYALAATVALAPRATQRWLMVADTGLTQAAVARHRRELAAGTLAGRIPAAVDESTRRLRACVAAADGRQAGGAETTTAHHFANVLFNVLRGGIFAAGYDLPMRDFAAFVHTRHRGVAARHAAWLAAQPDFVARGALLADLAAGPDRDLERLGLEYLPLTFSRRHGDPSRPWNTFDIRTRDEAGGRVLHYEGNWRDIFQNWEALGLSFPDFLGSAIAKFLNASTRDGYNPYRISRDGIGWEVPSPDHPWAAIGYWGDHQTVYLLKFLEWSARFHPGFLPAWLRRAVFSYADVPYRLAAYDAMRENPHATIAFDADRHRAIEQRVALHGTDARLVHRADGTVLHVTLAEKLLVLILTRLTNFVPGGGIWMNTQRPEWNDANNALVGYGVSVVTLAYLRRFLAHVATHLLPALGRDPVPVSAAVAGLLRETVRALEAGRAGLAAPDPGDDDRRRIVDTLGRAGTAYRTAVYADGDGAAAALDPAEIARLLAVALAQVDATLRANRRPDGLAHTYNLLEFTGPRPALRLHPLGPMLEGQVALLSSGSLAPAEAVALLDALRQSPLYRADQHSYLLYPDRELPGFLERNVIPPAVLAACPLLENLLAAGEALLVHRDADGHARFHPGLVNHAALEQRLQSLAADPRWTAAVATGAAGAKAAYEAVFRHRAYPGRSGSMFGYEGLGCIYWHMVAKLLLAVQENVFLAEAAGDPAAGELARRYHDIRDGLGFNKTPAAYGAFPTDPYSHTPGHAGAQQPGMTGQVKEEILTRFGELGVRIDGGTIEFRPTLLLAGEFATAPVAFPVSDKAGAETVLALPAGTLGFTFCGVPVIYRRSAGPRHLRLHLNDGRTRGVPGAKLDAPLSAGVFARSGGVTRIEVDLGAAFQPLFR